jgi:hypothetical protein
VGRRAARIRRASGVQVSHMTLAAAVAWPGTLDGVSVVELRTLTVGEYLEWISSRAVETLPPRGAWVSGAEGAYVSAVAAGLGVLSPIVVARVAHDGPWLMVDGELRTDALRRAARASGRLASAPLALAVLRVPSRETAIALRVALNGCRSRRVLHDLLAAVAQVGGKWSAFARAAEIISARLGVPRHVAMTMSVRALCVMLLYPNHAACRRVSPLTGTVAMKLAMSTPEEVERALAALDSALQRMDAVPATPAAFAGALAEILEEGAGGAGQDRASKNRRAACIALLPFARGVGSTVTISMRKLTEGMPGAIERELRAIVRELVASGACAGSGHPMGRIICRKGALREYLRKVDPTLPI